MSDSYPPASTPLYADGPEPYSEGSAAYPNDATADSYGSTPSTYAEPTTTNSSGASLDDAKSKASDVAGAGVDATKHVAGSVKEQTTNVAGEAKSQAKNLLDQTKSELQDQASTQQKRVATGLHSVSDELGSMAEKSDDNGLATDLVRQASGRVKSVASWLENRDPGSLLDEVRSFAQQRPGTFIAVAAAAGILAGRLTRSVASNASDSTPSTDTMTDAPANAQESVVADTYQPTATYETPESFGLGAAQLPTGDYDGRTL